SGTIVFRNDRQQINRAVADEIKHNFDQEGTIVNTLPKIINSYSLLSLQWHLIGEVNVDRLFLHANSLKNKMIVLFLVFGGMIVLLAFFGSRRLYKPIHVMTAKLKSITMVDKKQASSEFDYINSTLDVMVDRHSLLETHHEKSKRLLVNTLLYDLIKGNTSSRSDIEYYLEEYRSNMVICVFHISPKTGASEQSFVEFFEQCVSPHFFTVLFSDSPDQHIGLFKLPHSDLNAFLAELTICVESGPMRLDDICISMGDIYHDITHINKSYIEAMYAYNMGRIHTQETNMYCYSKLSMDGRLDIYNEVSLDELELAIRQQNEKIYTNLLEQLFRDDISIMKYYLHLYSVVSLTIRLYDEESVVFLNEMNELLTNNTIMNTTIVKTFFHEKFRSFKNDYLVIKDDKQYIEKLEKYAIDNYHKQISLVDVSEYLGLSKPYTCRLIKQHSNTTFIEFLNRHRIEQAKLLLDDAKCKISTVYSKVGFNSNSYFMKVFKNYTGVTPTEYKELSLNRLNVTESHH
ncbi:MAG: helix-turn-helix domain-containing protein, partial [Paenibacillaceae bacterium]|nr:helix-turn-helix domain-containing protein [Paenibacillaceae bacterium]